TRYRRTFISHATVRGRGSSIPPRLSQELKPRLKFLGVDVLAEVPLLEKPLGLVEAKSQEFFKTAVANPAASVLFQEENLPGLAFQVYSFGAKPLRDVFRYFKLDVHNCLHTDASPFTATTALWPTPRKLDDGLRPRFLNLQPCQTGPTSNRWRGP